MSSSIINNSYMVGVAGRNLVLQTLGKVYVKVNDKYYDLKFEGVATDDSGEVLPDIYVVNTKDEAISMAYPGDSKLIISLDGGLFVTSGGKIIEWEFKIPAQDLDLDNLTINGTLTINSLDEKAPLVINSQELIENLNAQYLNGFESKDFARKDFAETINGLWYFKNLIVRGQLYSDQDSRTVLDFRNSSLTVDTITVQNLRWPGLQKDKTSLMDAINKRLWASKKIKFSTYYEIANTKQSWYNDLSLMFLNMYADEELPNDVSIDVWATAFFIDPTVAYEDFELKDFSQQSVINSTNQYLQSQGVSYQIEDYLSLYYNWFDWKSLTDPIVISFKVPNTYKLTPNYNIEIGQYVNLDDNTVKYELYEGTISKVDVDEQTIYVVFNTDYIDTNIFLNVDYLVLKDHLLDPMHVGGILIDSISPNTPIIDILNNSTYTFALYSDEEIKLLQNNNVIGRIGFLDSLASDVFGDMEGMGIFFNGVSLSTLVGDNLTKQDIIDFASSNKSKVFLKNPNIWLGGVSVFNPDGSGMISDGRIIWTANKLIISDVNINNSELENCTIKNSTIDQQTFDNSNLQAGGDLTGTYPNPELGNSVVKTENIDDAAVTQEKIQADVKISNPESLKFTVDGVEDQYDGSEEKSVTIPQQLPNPFKLTLIIGGVAYEYDGTSDVTIAIS